MLEFKVENLGKIKDATFKINKFTVVTGQNGTGKSFFSKSLYSIFSTIENYSVKKFFSTNLDNFKNITLHQKNLLSKHKDYSSNVELISDIEFILNYIEKIQKELDFDVNKELAFENEDIVCFKEEVLKLKHEFEKRLSVLEKESSIYYEHGIEYFKFLLFMSDGLISTYSVVLQSQISNELRENFQVQTVSELINFDAQEAKISCEDLFSITLNKENKIDVDLEVDAINFFRKKPNSVFFESPAYWRVRDALIDAKMKSGDNYLSGVPKYFFDLDSSLKLKSKEVTLYPDVYNEIKSELNGEFKIENNELSFIEGDNNKISKNLVSFGMTNIGMLNTLIANNVVNEGSYIFIDEPETNLHPDWQILMIKSLIKLSEFGVNVIINTHSIEILKFIEIYFKKFVGENIDDLLSVNFIDNDGTMLEFDSSCPYEQVKEARSTLSSSYFELYMDDK
ncbi:AAA family ATPase [Photobacterium leiognathi]|uniref:AAA family ATPase n=1 Tax=Photobacterium leiognathi TaxID=553611 RepID=UPI0029821A15|nr:AAA family ATPase [Photobacterium leiognathi]